MSDAVLRLLTMLVLFAFVVLAAQLLIGRFVERSGKRRAVNKRLRLIEAGVDREVVTTMLRKEMPRGLAGAPYIEQHRIDLDAITAETLIFEGPATEAVRAFPANVNVVAALSLAGIGPERTRIKLYAVPGQARNQHRITVEGAFGRLRIEVENVPSENPRTGRLSYLSAIAMLREMGAAVQVGN